MRRICALLIVLVAFGVAADDNRPLGDRTRQYLIDLVRLDTSNPPGNETHVAEYLKQVADAPRDSLRTAGRRSSPPEFRGPPEGQRQRPSPSSDGP